MSFDMTSPARIPYAQRLDKLILGDWIVVDRAPIALDHTGSTFSVGYIVELATTGERAFLKALSLESIIQQSNAQDAPAALAEALGIYNAEVEVCRKCSGLEHVVEFLHTGTVLVDPQEPLSIVPYLIFEQAEFDVRACMELSKDLDVAWAFGCLHHIAQGIAGMHARGVAHRDVKPSNILLFGRDLSKLGDLGRACDRITPGPFDDLKIGGAWSYAPPDLLYENFAGSNGPGWEEHHLSCDLYLLGSMMVFLLAQTTMTALLLSHIPPEAQPARIIGQGWSGDYAGVLPIVQRAFAESLDDFCDAAPVALAPELRPLLAQLCEPDPRRRGFSSARAMRHGSPYDLQGFIARFDNLHKRAESRVGLRRAAPAATP
jgi:serine/threonine protein kinase